jgi:hypothetical protein
MEFQLLRVKKSDWIAFRDVIVEDQERGNANKKSAWQLAKDALLRAHYARDSRREDVLVKLVTELIRQCLLEEDASHYQVLNPTGKEPMPEKPNAA